MDIIKRIARNIVRGFYKNIYHTCYKKRALVSYLTAGFRKKYLSHTNRLEVDLICQAFNELGFRVDLTDYQYDWKINYSCYDVICGFGIPFSKAIDRCSRDRRFKLMYYINNALNLTDEVKRIKYLKERTGYAIIPRRNYCDHEIYKCLAMADGVISLGNKWTASTILPYNKNVFSVPAPLYLEAIPQIACKRKNIQEAKKHFLWFGSLGAVHKGLDILLDVFSREKTLHLHVCGNVTKEQDFIDIYGDKLFCSPNIHYHGFVSIDSALFRQLIQECLFIIHPSCSEGSSTAVLTCMAAGLIPIITRESGVDIQNWGYFINDIQIDAFRDQIVHLSMDVENEAVDCSSKAAVYVREMHSRYRYVTELKKAIETMCSGVK